MALLFAVFILIQIFGGVVGVAQEGSGSNFISLGSSLFPTAQPTAWLSPSGRFAFGFYSQGGGYAVGIWLVDSFENTVVWTANRDDPPVSSTATLELTMEGKLLLRSDDHRSEEKVIAGSSNNSASSASMLDSGNFVLYDKDLVIIWESFNFPTDSILGGQRLSNGSELVSSLSSTNHSSGRYRLKMQNDGNLVMYPINTADDGVDSYWSSNTFDYRSKHCLYLNSTGSLLLINNTEYSSIIRVSSNSSSHNDSVIYRATIGDDGNFRLYSHSSNSSEILVEKFLQNPCDVKGLCGLNSYCTLNDEQPYCRCVPGSDSVDPDQLSSGCERNFTKTRCENGKDNATFYSMTKTENLWWDDHPYFQASRESMPIEDCKNSCLNDCDCDAVVFTTSCTKHKFPLRFVRRDYEKSSTVLFKVGMISINYDNKSIPAPVEPPVVVVMTTSKKTWMLILIISLGFSIYSCAALASSGFFIFKFRLMKYKRLLEAGTRGLIEEFILRSYTYKELRKATNGFKEVLGKGSFGTVYKGSFYKGKKVVAIKRLEKVVEEGEREFRAEMQVIGRTHHKNLVRLLGYCAEGLKRLLVYEYMSNGTLADLLFRAERRPEWNERVRIALDVARGILYLHEECEAPIIHCDIKPQNILMDEFWTAKISDFGLAKLLMPDQTRSFTGVRGTRGYLAPEWQKNTPISVKVDIFSYGIVLLEIICCRRNLEVHVSNSEEIVLSSWAYKCFASGKLDKLVEGEEVDKRTLERLVRVGLWCIQDEPALRPSMKCVVLMLEGITDISAPPCAIEPVIIELSRMNLEEAAVKGKRQGLVILYGLFSGETETNIP